MANEITFSGSLNFFKPSVMSQAEAIGVVNMLQSVTGNPFVKNSVLIGLAATIIPLGQVTVPGMCAFHNVDQNNYISIQNGSGGTEFLRLIQSDWVFCRIGPGVVPYGLANTAACWLEYFIISA
jgi:hypothetical protein